MTRPATWTTRDGTVVRVRDMTDDRLVNACRMILRDARRILDDELCAGIAFISTLRGEMATYYAEADLRRLMDEDPVDFVVECYAHLFDAARRRGLMTRVGADVATRGKDEGRIPF